MAYKATDEKWYLILGNHEYAYDDHNCTTYGPFNTEEEAFGELDHHSNPGGSESDDEGMREPPENPQAPSGSRVSYWGYNPKL
tara:strand:- start:5847 stop:6095 length:249 start_codon:yes stop_codon:yes gene_type:complete